MALAPQWKRGIMVMANEEVIDTRYTLITDINGNPPFSGEILEKSLEKSHRAQLIGICKRN